MKALTKQLCYKLVLDEKRDKDLTYRKVKEGSWRMGDCALLDGDAD